ncbi:hypothetical protein DU500_06090 [Haloplanus rubicundus]|uniref:Uncharacterized protein n=1 Tax=Haloplanus rubicundus TaxID=1547898 RepID=A0A345EB19_9EURY|nr:hypothetical protein [Haloplanus rubicundus]AXG06047.1 hypothetical protein DU500_06090 [Haloplanus rubicundus]AXG09391.1 hypothetical protein DU484_05615 [Haloplanus rubicundus]
MHRRAFVASAGGTLASVAGCLGWRRRSDGPPPEDEPTGTATPTPRSGEPAAGVTVDALRLQYGVVTPMSPDSIGVSNTDTPYLVASVRVDGPLSRDEFGLRMGDVRYSPTRIDRLYRTAWGDDHWYERGRDDGLVLFEAPPAPTKHLRLTWPGGERPVGEDIVTRIDASAPAFSATLDVPSRYGGSTAPPITVEVANERSTGSRFLGALNRGGPQVASIPVARVSELVPAGERTTVTVADSWSGLPDDEHVGDDEADVTYRLYVAGGQASAEIRLVE